MAFAITILWLVFVLWAAYYADNFWSSVLGRIYWIVLAPGVIIHELSHVVACLVTFAKIRRVKLFSPTGGEVEHGPSRIPVVGQVVISMAPLAGCAAVLALVAWLLKAPLAAAVAAPPWTIAPVSLDGCGHFCRECWAMFRSLCLELWRADFTNWRTYVFIYAAVCLGVSMRPSKQDFRNAFWGLALIGVLIAVADYLVGLTGRVDIILTYVLPAVRKPLHYLVAFLGLTTVLTVAASILRWIIRRLTGSRKPASSPEPKTK